MNIATGLDRTFKKRVAEVSEILKENYSKPDSKDYYGYMIDRFVDLGGDNSVYYAIADYWSMLKELNAHYKRNKEFANTLNRIIEDGSDMGGIVNAGERLKALFRFFDGFYNYDFTSLIEMRRLDLYPNQFTSDDLDWLEDIVTIN